MAVTWNANYELTPLGQDSPTGADDEIRLLKDSVSKRMANEHETFETDNSSGAEGDDFVHKAGSGKIYYQKEAPTLRPDGVTSLNTEDAGRLWMKSSTLQLLVWTGSAWTGGVGARIDADSTIYPDGVLKFKVFDLVIPNGTNGLLTKHAHGISDAFADHRILTVECMNKTASIVFGGDTDLGTGNHIYNWFYDDTNLSIVRHGTSGKATFRTIISYV